MAGVPGIGNSLRPSRMTESRDRVSTTLYSIADAKMALGWEMDENYADAQLALIIESAQATLEKATGVFLAPRSVGFWFMNSEYLDIQELELNESDIAAVTDVIEWLPNDAGDLTATQLGSSNYEVEYSRKRTYIFRTDGKCFPCHPSNRVVKVTATKGLGPRDNDMGNVRAGMNFLVNEYIKVNGTTAPATMTMPNPFVKNPGFQRIVRQLQSSIVPAPKRIF